MIRFYVNRQTSAKLLSAEKVVFLIGGYNGYGLNFGDVLQLQGTIHWYQQQYPNALLCPFLHIKPAIEYANVLAMLARSWNIEQWVFYARDEEDLKEPLVSFELEPLQILQHDKEIVLHVYGGGFFNGLWGKWMLDLVEAVLEKFPISRYIITGQQIGPEFAFVLAKHCHLYQPDIIGCRDQLSVEFLKQHGITAIFGSDDALDEMFCYAGLEGLPDRACSENISFGLHLNLSNYVRTSFARQDQSLPTEDVLVKLEAICSSLKQRFGKETVPILVGAYLESRLDVHDTWLTIKTTGLTRYFPRFWGVDLPSALIHNKMGEIVPLLRSCKVFVGTSYHVTFFMKILGVPSLLLAFNDYYKQKKAGIEPSPPSIQDFLTTDPVFVLKDQEHSISIHRKSRNEFLQTLKEVFANPARHTYRKVVYLTARLAEQEQVNAELRLEKERLAQQLECVHQQNAILAEEFNKLKARLAEQEQVNAELSQKLRIIEASRAWKAVKKYWDLMARPSWRIILWPIQRIARIIWK
ncbi:MAG: polysaccharide pyruvyl transferase family protein [Thermosphaera sp.]